MTIKIQLPKPHPGQQKVLDSTAKYRILQCGRRWGKSLISQIIAIQYLLSGKKVAYITPTHELGRKWFKSILQYIPSEIITSDNKTDRTIELLTGGQLIFFSGENLDAVRGDKFHIVIIDEAAHIPLMVEQWPEAILPTLADYNGKAVIISTPYGKEWFYSMFVKGVSGEPGYESFHYTSYDNPTLPDGAIDELKKQMTKASFNQEILAIPGENQANPFGTDNIRNNTITELSTKPTIVYGIDIARTFDYSVITGIDADGCMSYFARWKAPWEITKERIRQLPGNILKVMDSTGAGSVMYEQLQLECQNIIGYTFTNSSKTNLIHQLILDVERGAVKFNEETASEMHVFEYKYSSSGVLTYNAQSGFHDDTVIALALANMYKTQAVHTSNWKLYSA